MRGRAVESFNSSKQSITGGHGRRQSDVFRVQRFIITVLQLRKRQEFKETIVNQCFSPRHPSSLNMSLTMFRPPTVLNILLTMVR